MKSCRLVVKAPAWREQCLICLFRSYFFDMNILIHCSLQMNAMYKITKLQRGAHDGKL